MTSEKEQKEAEAKEKKRQIAMRNLGEETLQNLALAYFVSEEKDFGEADNAAVEQFKYMPAIKEDTILLDSLLGSRHGGKRYTGNVSEYKIIHDAGAIIQESLSRIKVADALQLIGSNSKIAGSYSDIYLSDLLESKKEKDKELAKRIMDSYLAYFISSGVSDAYADRAKTVKKSLETFLTESTKEEAKRRR